MPLSTGTFVGSLALGWGLFNLIEGLIDHELLGIHHVVEAGNHLLWDMAFLGSGIVLILIGWGTVRANRGGDVPVRRDGVFSGDAHE